MASPAHISEAQLDANRENARHSPGQRTEAGKSRTRLNGLRHGLTGQTALLPDEDRAAYDRHHTEFLAELKPEGVIEIQIAHHIADDYWRLNRLKAVENNIFALGIEAHSGEFHENPEWDAALGQAQTFLEQSRQINLLSLYEQRLNRAIQTKQKELAELQRIRKVAATGVSKETRNGFGFSTAESAPATGQKPNATTPKSPDSAFGKPPIPRAA
jgi:hypothetical protein